jgi:hypothetical protein
MTHLGYSLFARDALEPERTYSFSSPVSHHGYSEDGTRLLVLTADQTVYVLQSAAISASGSAESRARTSRSVTATVF